MNFKGRIEEAKIENGKKGQYVNMKIGGQYLNDFNGAFDISKAKVGDEVDVEYSESKATNNKGYPFKNVEKITVVTPAEQFAKDAQAFMPDNPSTGASYNSGNIPVSDDAVKQIVNLEEIVAEEANVLRLCKEAVDKLYEKELAEGKVDLTQLPRVVNGLFVDVSKTYYFKCKEAQGY